MQRDVSDLMFIKNMDIS